MLPGTFIRNFDRGRLRNLLLLFFVALAVPTAVLIWQAYSQLKWESFHQYRGVAEELTNRIDSRLIEMIRIADTRSFADYTFVVVAGDPSANFMQRSPLSNYPVTEDLPGVLGYFQVDAVGAFSTPLLPPQGTTAGLLGIGKDEFSNRQVLAQQIQAVLADNRLVQYRPEAELRRALAPANELEEDAEIDGNRDQMPGDEYSVSESPGVVSFEAEPLEESSVVGGFADVATGNKDAADKLQAMAGEETTVFNQTYNQEVFDALNQPRSFAETSPGTARRLKGNDADGDTADLQQQLQTIGKVSELKLDDAYQKKSEVVERKEKSELGEDRSYAPMRNKRREQIALPESVAVGEAQALASSIGPADLRISTFESEVDPLEFSLLDSGHFVLFRKVWRDGQRYIQGVLIDPDAFIRDVIDTRFSETALSDMSSLIIAYQDDVIHSITRAARGGDYASGAEAFDGALLYRSRLSTPLDSLELIFSIDRLPPGPGASVLSWVTLVLAIVFVGGFMTLYRLGLSQINLAKQQQDFVSAVSHELKTPLTSIRMYGEMLKEGWADEEKKQSYYEFIHDESERLTRLISNVLQLAKITRNEPQFDLQPTPVGELMSNIESKISNQVQRAGFELRFTRDHDAEQAIIDIDEDCFAQIVINLVDNAIKFSKSTKIKVIEISCATQTDGAVMFTVRDYGPGVPKDQMKKIFSLFYRSESELTRETVGTGIGLAIVHQLSLAMGGKVDVVNADPGAEFRVTFSSKQ